jgi:hypothetical protein
MNFLKCSLTSILLLVSSTAFSQTLTGTIETIHSNLYSRIVYVYLEGKPTFDGGGCTSEWAAVSMDDTDFRDFVFPLLLSAHETNKQVNITVSGCVANQPEMPKIQWVDLHPRQAYLPY